MSRSIAMLFLAGATFALGCQQSPTTPAQSTTAPPVATQLVFTAQPSATAGGQVLTPAVQVAIQDASGNTVTTATNSLTLAVGTNPAGGMLSGTVTVSAVNGVATFSTLSINKAGTGYTLVATSGTLTGATSNPFNIVAGTATQLVFTAQPSNAVAGVAITPAVVVGAQDALGNTVTSFTGTVTMALGTNPAGGTLSGTLAVAAVSGVATFSTLSINKAGTGYTLAPRATGLTGATSEAFATMPGPASQLVFTGQPTNTWWYGTISPPVIVTAKDVFGNVATGFTGSMTMALGTNPHGGTLSGTTTAAVVNGVATFSNLSIDTAWVYELAVAAAALPPTFSIPFAVYSFGSGTGISYWGGPVIYTPKIAALYWSSSVIYNGGPAPGTTGGGVQDGSLVGFFLRNLGGSPFFNIVTTYAAVGAFVRNVATYTQYWADATAPGTAPTDAEIQAEIEHGFTSGALPYDVNTMYAVFTGPGIDLGGGFLTQYCGYHSFFVDALGRNVKYVAMPYDYAETATANCFAQSATPNNDPGADAEVNVLAHELAETITDPNLDAWFDNSGNEIGDLCAWRFGGTFTTTTGAQANQVLGGKNFLVQMLWVDAATEDTPVGCQQNWTALAATSLAPSSRVAGTSRSFAWRGRHIFPPHKK